MGFGIATQTGVSAAIQSIPSMMANKGLRNGYGATFAENFTDGTNTLDPRITFSRASNATVTGSNGLIQYAPHNLLTYSEQFDNAYWAKYQTTITANAVVAPDGTITADKLVESTANDTHNINKFNAVATNKGEFTFSIYLKAAERTKAEISIVPVNPNDFSNDARASINLVTGSVTSTTRATASITSVGNDWYRCVISSTQIKLSASAGVQPLVTLVDAAGNSVYTGDGVSGIYIWGAQLNVASLQDYYPTTVKNLLGYSEAFDNAAWTKSNSFIQTNLLTYSQEFDNAAWTKTGSSITANSVSAPNGSLTADTIVENTATSGHSVQQTVTVASTAQTISAYVRPNGRNLRINLSDNTTGNVQALFDLSNGTAGTITTGGSWSAATSSITSVGGGWFRVSLTATRGAGTQTVVNYELANGTTVSYTGDGTSGAFIWGAQLVQGSVAGDYQQTTSAALPVQYQAPNGTMTADKLVENTATAEHRVQVTPTLGSAPITASVYFKASERSWSFIRLDDAVSSKYAYFNLATGVVGTVTSGLTASITSVGNGWYRCSALFSAPTAGSGAVIFAPTTGNSTTSYAGDGTSGIYIWGAQLSDSASLDTYVNNPVAAPTAAAYYGARFDYDPVTLQPKGLLIEEQRTNLLLRSEEFDNASWSKSNMTVVANNATSPSGAVNADTLTSTGNASVVQVVTGSANTAYTGSVWLRVPSGTLAINLYRTDNGTGFSSVVANVTTTWQRFTITATSSATASQVFFQVGGGNTFPNGSTLEVWGAQLEAGAFATSYIPTTTAQVTRSADVALIQGSNFSSWYNVNEGTLYAQGITSPRTTAVANGEHVATLSSTLSLLRGASSVSLGWFIGSASFRSFGFTTANALFKSAGGYLTGDNAATLNGGSLVTDTGSTYGTPVSLYIGANSAGAQPLNGHIRQIAYFPRRLSNSELQAITS